MSCRLQNDKEDGTMKDYRGIIQNVIETAEQMSVRGSTDAQRLCTIVYTLSAIQNEMTQEMEAEAAQDVRAAVEAGTGEKNEENGG